MAGDIHELHKLAPSPAARAQSAPPAVTTRCLVRVVLQITVYPMCHGTHSDRSIACSKLSCGIPVSKPCVAERGPTASTVSINELLRTRELELDSPHSYPVEHQCSFLIPPHHHYLLSIHIAKAPNVFQSGRRNIKISTFSTQPILCLLQPGYHCHMLLVEVYVAEESITAASYWQKMV